MTEKEIQLLGFEKESYYDLLKNTNYYYFKDVANGLGFISNSDNATIEGEWYIDFFNTEPIIRFFDFGEVQGLLNTLEKNIIQ